MKSFFTCLFLLLCTLTLSACAGIGTSPKGLEVPIEKAAIKLNADTRDGGYKLVGTEELKNWLGEKKTLIIIDTMPQPDFAKGHIPGAVNGVMPKAEKELTPADIEAFLQIAGPDKEQAIVVYCGFVSCRRSHLGAKVLVENGYTNVLRYPAGIIGWKESGASVAK